MFWHMHSQISLIVCIFQCNRQRTVMYPRPCNICKMPTQTCSATVENGVYMFVKSVQIHTFLFLTAQRASVRLLLSLLVLYYSVYLACTKLVLAQVHLDISSPSLPEDSLTFSPWPGLQCHSQLELKAHQASFLHFAILSAALHQI